ncbi:hypothetical protein BS78_02G192800 [Paspalum vaginatum]|nr:hypothetical protein BS78_02G192800 [Paspalum vaginatum]
MDDGATTTTTSSSSSSRRGYRYKGKGISSRVRCPPHSARCLCLYLLLSLTLLLAAAAALLAVFVARLKKPAFYLQSIQMDRSFSLRQASSTTSNRSGGANGSAPTTTACAVASLLFAAQNRNAIGIRYGATVLRVAYANESVGAMDVPAFYQPPRSANVTVLMHAVLAQRDVTRLLVQELSAQRRYLEIRVAGSIDARTHVMNFPLPKVQVRTDSTFRWIAYLEPTTRTLCCGRESSPSWHARQSWYLHCPTSHRSAL